PTKEHKLLTYMPADVTRPPDIKVIKNKLDKAGILVQHLVSLAGGALTSEFSERLSMIPDEDIETSILLNLTSHLFLVKYLMDREPLSFDRSVVFVSSINA